MSVLSYTQEGVPPLCTTAFFPLLFSPLLYSSLLSCHLLILHHSSILSSLFFYPVPSFFLPFYLSIFPASIPSFLPSLFLAPPSAYLSRLVSSRTVSSLSSIRFLLPYCVSFPSYSPLSTLLFSLSALCFLLLTITVATTATTSSLKY